MTEKTLPTYLSEKIVDCLEQIRFSKDRIISELFTATKEAQEEYRLECIAHRDLANVFVDDLLEHATVEEIYKIFTEYTPEAYKLFNEFNMDIKNPLLLRINALPGPKQVWEWKRKFSPILSRLI